MQYQPRSPRQPSGSNAPWGRMLPWKNSGGAPKRKLRDDPPNLPNALAIVDDLPDTVQPLAMHEHHAVHELDTVAAAGGEDLLYVAGGGCDRLFGQYMLSSLGSTDQPRLADAGRQGNIHGIHLVAGQQRVVAAEGMWRRVEGSMLLTVGDETPAALRSRPATAVNEQFSRSDRQPVPARSPPYPRFPIDKSSDSWCQYLIDTIDYPIDGTVVGMRRRQTVLPAGPQRPEGSNSPARQFR